jgi:hypothetical protein
VLADFPLVRDAVSDLVVDCFAAESVAYSAADFVDRMAWDPWSECAMARVLASEVATRVADTALSLQGGRASLETSDFFQSLNDCRALSLLDNPSDALLSSALLHALKDGHGGSVPPPGVIGALGERALRRARRTLVQTLPWVHPTLRDASEIFTACAEQITIHGNRLRREALADVAEMQHAQLRLSRSLCALFALGASLSRATADLHREGETGAKRQADVVHALARRTEVTVSDQLDAIQHGDDAIRLAIAARAYSDDGYPFDVC